MQVQLFQCCMPLLSPLDHTPVQARLDHQPQKTLLIASQPAGSIIGCSSGATASAVQPSCPNLFHPHENARLWSSRMTVWRAPQATCRDKFSCSAMFFQWKHSTVSILPFKLPMDEVSCTMIPRDKPGHPCILCHDMGGTSYSAARAAVLQCTGTMLSESHSWPG